MSGGHKTKWTFNTLEYMLLEKHGRQVRIEISRVHACDSTNENINSLVYDQSVATTLLIDYSNRS